jgi:ABC-type ATPase involved in cell division
LISAQLALGISRAGARSRALAALERVGAAGCEQLRPQGLDCGEAVRVSIAAALLREPALLLVDEPTVGVAALEQDEIALLLRSLTREDMAILMSVDETGVGMFAADRTLSLDQGRLRGHVAPELGEVVELPLPVTG